VIIKGTTEQMVEKGASLLYQSCKAFIRTKGSVVLAVPGGRSVAGIFRLLVTFRLDWQKVHIFMLDERLVPEDHPESNCRLVRQFFGPLDVAGMIHPFIYDPERPEESVAGYGEELARYGTGFDIVLASSGEDGHIGSLFPNHPSVQARGARFILVNDSPKPPSSRMSAGVELLRRADTGVLLFLGDGKRNALRNFCDGDLAYNQCPAKITTMMSTYYVLTDQEVDLQ
jgi:6-phosphogluconolactonase